MEELRIVHALFLEADKLYILCYDLICEINFGCDGNEDV